MKTTLTFLFVLTLTSIFGQATIEWSPEYRLQLKDFQSPQTEINPELNSYAIFSGNNMEFSYQMTNAQFMFTKNFNSKVSTVFNRNAAVITAPDSAMAQKLVKFGQYSFDLTELYSRKFRKKMYENKGVFSDASFFKPIHEELQEQMNAELARVMKAIDLGQKSELLNEEHQKVLRQIEEMSDFCKECKPPKKKKKRSQSLYA
ncbi:MAG: hypothetical protein R8G66_31255 [Cytophagales bacterium]|nr:hypothetical protein [Cytophagales bacterium]